MALVTRTNGRWRLYAINATTGWDEANERTEFWIELLVDGVIEQTLMLTPEEAGELMTELADYIREFPNQP